MGNACLGGVFVNGGKGEAADLVKFFINFCNIHDDIFPFNFLTATMPRPVSASDTSRPWVDLDDAIQNGLIEVKESQNKALKP